MIRIMEQYANIWKCHICLIKSLKSRIVDKRIKRSLEVDVIIAKNKQELEYKKRIYAMRYGPNVLHHASKYSLIGTQDEIIDKIREYEKVGVEQLLLAFQDPFDLDALMLFINATNSL